MANFTGTAKQIAIRAAMAANPRQKGEGKLAYCKRIGGLAGCPTPTVYNEFKWQEWTRLGQELRAKEEAERKFKPIPFDADGLGPLQNFRGWVTEFGRLKLVVECYLTFARGRPEAYPVSMLSQLREICERAQCRAAQDKTR